MENAQKKKNAIGSVSGLWATSKKGNYSQMFILFMTKTMLKETQFYVSRIVARYNYDWLFVGPRTESHCIVSEWNTMVLNNQD